jgi:hypothetical protein
MVRRKKEEGGENENKIIVHYTHFSSVPPLWQWKIA